MPRLLLRQEAVAMKSESHSAAPRRVAVSSLSTKGIANRSRTYALVFAATFAAVAAVHPAASQTYSVLYTFTGAAGDGAYPYATLVVDHAGNIYGTTYGGGTYGYGTVFKLDTSGNETVLYTFTGAGDGGKPEAGLWMDSAGDLYGTTEYGGLFNFGTVFKLDPTGAETVLHSFAGGGTDGEYPVAGLVPHGGNLYGTTYFGGARYVGTVFEMSKAGKEKIVRSFRQGPGDGQYPYGGVTLDAAGNAYGTTFDGGAFDLGIVFKVDATGKETLLHSFSGPPDGGAPFSGLVQDETGNIYGATDRGGDASCYSSLGCGVVFKLDSTGTETVLHTFTGFPNDGEFPGTGLARDSSGNLYGTTGEGGSSNNGTVFEISSSGTETVLHSFAGGTDGKLPSAALALDKAGNLYGTTYWGGDTLCGDFTGCGVIFKLTP
jgi:uncharacterized repeat protein (TIGR03803 family)